jgi:hypothetical protein
MNLPIHFIDKNKYNNTKGRFLKVSFSFVLFALVLTTISVYFFKNLYFVVAGAALIMGWAQIANF